MNHVLFSVGIIVFLLTVYGTVVTGGYLVRAAQQEQRQHEPDENAVDMTVRRAR